MTREYVARSRASRRCRSNTIATVRTSMRPRGVTSSESAANAAWTALISLDAITDVRELTRLLGA